MTAGGSLRALRARARTHETETELEKQERRRIRELRRAAMPMRNIDSFVYVRPRTDNDPTAVSLVYFAVNKEHRLLKIGISTNVPRRLKDLSKPIPVELLFSFPGSRKDEQFFHRVLRPHQTVGEWYRLTPESESFVSTLRTRYCENRTTPTRARAHEGDEK
jgi:Meiotically up-regulated gene 113